VRCGEKGPWKGKATVREVVIVGGGEHEEQMEEGVGRKELLSHLTFIYIHTQST